MTALGTALPVLKHIKNAVVPDREGHHRIWFGLCRGCILPLHLRHQFLWPLGVYEPEIRRFVRAYVGPGDTCYDIGSARGYYAFAFARLSEPRGYVYGFEPDPYFFSLLTGAVPLNPHIRSTIEVRSLFVSDAVSTDEHRATLDHLVYEGGCRPPHLLKIDVEGDEVRVLKGATRVLREYRPRVIVEVHSLALEQECIRLLNAASYQVRIVNQSRFFPDYRPIEHNRWLCATVPGT